MRRFRFIFGLVFVLAATLQAVAATNSADVAHLQVQLIIPDGQLYLGVQNGAGLYFKMEPGWHIYWKNPGDSGEPPHIHWTLPAGITASPMQFPAPERLPLGPLMDFGYENEVYFPIPLTVSSFSKSCFSANRKNPYRLSASSRTCVWMWSATSAPAAGISVNVGTLMATS